MSVGEGDERCPHVESVSLQEKEAARSSASALHRESTQGAVGKQERDPSDTESAWAPRAARDTCMKPPDW